MKPGATTFHSALLQDGTFVQHNYHQARPFASFLPGIAGEHGIPMWVFYCNRGQAITSCGTRDKDGAILAYHPANTAYQRVSVEGFRTFIWSAGEVYEPFRVGAKGARQTLWVRAHELEIEDDNPSLGWRVHVLYFTLPQMPWGALVRWVTLTNTSRRARLVRIADGVARFVPGSVCVADYVHMSNTEAGVIETLTPAPGVLVSRARVIHYDTVTPDFNTTFNYLTTVVTGAGQPQVQMIGDPREIFDEGGDLHMPQAWVARDGRVRRGALRSRGFMPCAFACFARNLPAGSSCTWFSCVGNVAAPRDVTRLRTLLAKPDWLAKKRDENARLIAQIEDRMWTVTSQPTFDYYCRQTYLDNVLRGGLPVSLGRQIFHLYFRKHGDMERDYNWFALEPAYYSQGNANYRDINQNRRADVLFHPPVELTNVRTFFNALQLDGNNPLVYLGTAFALPIDLPTRALPAQLRTLATKFAGALTTPGELARAALQEKLPPPQVLATLLAHARRVDRFGGSDGYWSDHWVYCLDLLENYLAVYPDHAAAALFKDCSYTYHDNPEIMLPRDTRFTLDEARGVVRQHNALTRDPEKAALIAARRDDPTCVRTEHGKGVVYRTTLSEKILSVVAVKMALLDPEELGLEMRGNRPGWNDALNGLPGLIGSSINETAELLRLVRFLHAHLPAHGGISCCVELAELVRDLRASWDASATALARWHARNDALERYLTDTRLGVDGATTTITMDELQETLAMWETVLQSAIRRARDERTGLYHGYFFYNVTQYRVLPGPDGAPRRHDGHPCVWPESFTRVTLPPFLEPQVRVMYVLEGPAAARALHRAVLRSPLYDRTLRMFVLNAPLARITQEIGRANIFPPGWLENQSVWMHMEYKYFFALLRAGLYEQFFAVARDALVPYQPPQRYGRSPLEHASFIASSAHEDRRIHGTGFYARLSGATVEFISMWLELSGAARIFSLDAQGALRARFQPILPAELFTRRAVTRTWESLEGRQTVTIPAHACAFVILGGTLLVYHNPQRRATFGPRAVTPATYHVRMRDGSTCTVAGPWLPTELALRLRTGEVARVDVELR
ncbi:MAG: hypothetical protein N2595_06030 [bacterium]|nr:hypothetical protein [bacterium]